MKSTELFACVSNMQEPSRHRSVTSSAGGCPPDPTESDLPQPSQPLLCRNSTALKWEGPVPDSTRSAVAGVLCELVTLPEFCHAASDRLVTSRLSGLLKGAVKQMEGAGKCVAVAPSRGRVLNSSLWDTLGLLALSMCSCSVHMCHLLAPCHRVSSRVPVQSSVVPCTATDTVLCRFVLAIFHLPRQTSWQERQEVW